MNRQVEGLIRNFSNDPEILQIDRKALTVDTVDQSGYEVRERSKVEVLSRLLDIDPPRLAIVFCNTKRSVDECTEALSARGYAADRLHGDITQHMRERVLKRFREGTVELLVATDVAARGLDIDNVDAVFNYDLPQDPEDYVHRIGRTGRAGRSGKAVSFVFGRDIYRIQNIERYTRQKIRRERIPTQEQVEGKRSDKLFETVRETLEAGDFSGHETHVDRLLDAGHTATDIASALFTLLYNTQSREGQEIAEDRPHHQQTRQKGDRGDRRERRSAQERPARRERPQPRDRDRRDAPSPPPAHDSHGHGQDQGDMVKLFVGVGKVGGLRPGDLAGMLYREAELPDGAVGRIALFPKHSVVDVRADLAAKVIDRCRNSTLRGRPFRLDYDRGGQN